MHLLRRKFKDSTGKYKLVILCLIWVLFMIPTFTPEHRWNEHTGNKTGLLSSLFELFYKSCQSKSWHRCFQHFKIYRTYGGWCHWLSRSEMFSVKYLLVLINILKNVSVNHFQRTALLFPASTTANDQRTYKDISLFTNFYWWKLYTIKDNAINIIQSKSAL